MTSAPLAEVFTFLIKKIVRVDTLRKKACAYLIDTYFNATDLTPPTVILFRQTTTREKEKKNISNGLGIYMLVSDYMEPLNLLVSQLNDAEMETEQRLTFWTL